MKVAYFSPMPPAKSGIADYSAALVEELGKLVHLEVFAGEGKAFDPGQFEVAVYQIGNNPYHEHAYRTALVHPGVVVMHEANLHHLITDLTIRRDDWDGYIAECAYNGGEAAGAFAERVRALEVGPDYEGLPMLRRLNEHAKAAIVHSHAVRSELRRAGFGGPVARILHGAWLVDTDRMAWRHRLGLNERTPLVGIFGFLKPYKRIAEALRAFRRLLRVEPDAKLILVGEPHPDFALASMIRGLGLSEAVRVLGFTPIEEFNGYLGACDIVLNLRFPTVGESSGTLLRALGMGKAVLVSDIGSFAEYPDDVVLKVPVDATEEDVLFEYLSLLASRVDVRREFGRRARKWVSEECSWVHTAERYAAFLEAVVQGREWLEVEGQARKQEGSRTVVVELGEPEPEPVAEAEAPPVSDAYLRTWAPTEDSKHYLDTHITRLVKTLSITPPGGPDDRVLEMGAYLQITPALKTKLGYGYVRGCYYGPAGGADHKVVLSEEGVPFECDVDLFDAERDRFPYPDESFSTVLCCELLEHLKEDPMFMMGEINRILKPGGHLVLTTPNIGSLHAISAILQGYHPGFFPAYIRPAEEGKEVEARHNREYTPKEIVLLLIDSGFDTTVLETGPFRDTPRPEEEWVLHLLDRYMLPLELRGDGIYAVGRKSGPVKRRYPDWLYSTGGA